MTRSTDYSLNKPGKLDFKDFLPTTNPLLEFIDDSRQCRYLYKYLLGLGCESIIIEPNYFDRDYLAEFSEFYSSSARGYRNICKRIHFFSTKISKDDLTKCLEADESQLGRLKTHYLGFSVIRPIPKSLGRTVLHWYTDKTPAFPRVKASREYKVHLAGIQLIVTGLAWQQQDTGVGACATIALWSAIHSAAFDEYYSIPTTPVITRLAHKKNSYGSPVFPTDGLTNYQMLEAIKELGFFPAFETGNRTNGFFSRARFGLLCSMFLRSGFPIILTGRLDGSSVGHAICLTGYRETSCGSAKPEKVQIFNENISTVYIHDDNIGANVRFEIGVETQGSLCSKEHFITIKAKASKHNAYGKDKESDPTSSYPKFIPKGMIVAMPGEIRLDPETLRNKAYEFTKLFCTSYNKLNKKSANVGFFLDIGYFKSADYLKSIIPKVMGKSSKSTISKVKLDLVENVSPMSRFLGVARIYYNSDAVFDILFDTSDSGANLSAFASVAFSNQYFILAQAIKKLYPRQGSKLGQIIKAY